MLFRPQKRAASRTEGLGTGTQWPLFVGFEESSDVAGFEDGSGWAEAGYEEHGTADFVGRDDLIRECSAQERKERAEERVGDPIKGGAGASSKTGLDEAGAKHAGSFEGQAEERVLRSAFDARPHDAAALGRISSLAGNVDEGHSGIKAGKGFCGVQGDVIGDARVLVLSEAGGGNAETEEAGVEAGELRFDGHVVREIDVDDLTQFGVRRAGGRAADGDDLRDTGIEEALAEDSLANHAGSAEEKDVHGGLRDADIDIVKQEGRVRDRELGISDS